jgi:hypothetical protein
VNVALIDSDILCYRIGFATNEETESDAISAMALFLEDLLLFDLTDTFEYELFLTGKSNFRNEVAVTAPYKGNRKDVKKPVHLPLLREYLVKGWGAQVSEGQEADDDIATRATELGDDAVIVSIDKDFMQVPGWHYNFVKTRKKICNTRGRVAVLLQADILIGDAPTTSRVLSCRPCTCEQDACGCEDGARVVCVLCGGVGKRKSVRKC